MAQAQKGLREILLEKQENIVKHWVLTLFDTYPADAQDFLRNQRNRFANPVGYTFLVATEALFKCLVEEAELEEFHVHMDKIIRIRAVQDFKPSEAISFVFMLKGILREALRDDLKDSGVRAQLEDLESTIDTLGLMALDIYVGCKEQLYQLRVDEVKRNTYMLLKRAKMLVERSEEDRDQGPQNLV